MNQVQLERRVGQRFDFQIPVLLRIASSDREGHGFTQNLSTKGLSFCTDMSLSAGEAVEVTLVMPAEITMADSMRLRCHGRVLRVISSGVASKHLAAVHIERYEYLTEETPALHRSDVCESDSALAAQ